MMTGANTISSHRPATFGNSTISAVGVGLRHQHMAEILKRRPNIEWLEIISDNFISRAHNQPTGGLDRKLLFAIREHYPISMHGVGLSLGSIDPLDKNYLSAIKQLAADLECNFISEHAAFVSVNQKHYHDLLPLPYTEEALAHLTQRIIQAQDFIGQRLIIENPSSYISCQYDTLTEGEFLAELCNRSDCQLLVDINNLYVNQHNHDWNAETFLTTIPAHRVSEIHLAGHSARDGLLIDSHGGPICADVWALYEQALQIFNPENLIEKNIPTLIEWDNNIPILDTLLEQARQAKHAQKKSLLKAAP